VFTNLRSVELSYFILFLVTMSIIPNECTLPAHNLPFAPQYHQITIFSIEMTNSVIATEIPTMIILQSLVDYPTCELLDAVEYIQIIDIETLLVSCTLV
jgi:hypothetical protein